MKTAQQVRFFRRTFTKIKCIKCGAVTYVCGGIAGTKSRRAVVSYCRACLVASRTSHC
jgi:hypothetical protein